MKPTLIALLLLAACQERVSEPASNDPVPLPSGAAAVAKPSSSPPAPRAATSAPPRRPPPSEDDPLEGRFDLRQATAGLPGSGDLYAILRTSSGKLVCELWEDKAPNTVANFVGLARGLRPFKKDGEWIKKPLYDGSEFYSVLKGFAMEAGSPSVKFNDDIGYFISDEIWEGAKHDQRGLLCMRAFTPGRSGSQFMILDAATPQLDQSFTIFGKCGPRGVLDAISNVEVEGGRPKSKLVLRKVEIVRARQPPG